MRTDAFAVRRNGGNKTEQKEVHKRRRRDAVRNSERAGGKGDK